MASVDEENRYREPDAGSTDLTQAISNPPVYANWAAARSNRPILETAEYRLFTDAWVTGEAKHGPYLFLNTVVRHQPKLIQPAIVLRIDLHMEFQPPDMTKTDADRYHAGSFPEEVAAISSLALGIRLRAGNLARSFVPRRDPKGIPREYDSNTIAGTVIRSHQEGVVVSSLAEGFHSLEALSILDQLPLLSAPDAVALIRAARLYQDALWLVESEPELAWLLLVSALETAANRWGRGISESAVERLQDSKPKLHEMLEGAGVPGLVEKVAEEIADTLGATRKFKGFVMEFLPPPPAERPPMIACQLSWDPTNIRKILGVVYKYRSKALHEGTPFPYPMCSPPFRDTDWAVPSEVPIGIATSAGGGTWLAEDTPILLHVFEYIARNSLLGWWRRSGATVARQ